MDDFERQRAAGADEPSLSIAEASACSGLSAHTLRYYERIGLIDAVTRSRGGQRCYRPSDLDWLAFLVRLRATGMSIADMQRFAGLRRAGDVSVVERLDLLRTHRAELEERIRSLRRHARALDQKIAHYELLVRDQTEVEDRHE